MVTAGLKQIQRRQAEERAEATSLRRGVERTHARETRKSQSPDQKYVIRKADGSPADPNARYLVLRLDTDPFAREAAQTYAEAVEESNPRLAAAVRTACVPQLKANWRLPASPRCECGANCHPVAMQELDRWVLEWECNDCCDPVAGPAIAWPFVQEFAEGEDFERIGIDWDIA
jgi:hypothetical protein